MLTLKSSVKKTEAFHRYARGDKANAHLVSDKPFEGGVKFCNVWWKPMMEEGEFTYDEIIRLFGK